MDAVCIWREYCSIEEVGAECGWSIGREPRGVWGISALVVTKPGLDFCQLCSWGEIPSFVGRFGLECPCQGFGAALGGIACEDHFDAGQGKCGGGELILADFGGVEDGAGSGEVGVRLFELAELLEDCCA